MSDQVKVGGGRVLKELTGKGGISGSSLLSFTPSKQAESLVVPRMYHVFPSTGIMGFLQCLTSLPVVDFLCLTIPRLHILNLPNIHFFPFITQTLWISTLISLSPSHSVPIALPGFDPQHCNVLSTVEPHLLTSYRFYLCACVCTCRSPCISYVCKCLKRPEGHRFPVTIHTGSCTLPDVSTGNQNQTLNCCTISKPYHHPLS